MLESLHQALSEGQPQTSAQLLPVKTQSPFLVRLASASPSVEQLRMSEPRVQQRPLSALPALSLTHPTPLCQEPLPMAGYIYPGAAADRQLGAGRWLTEMSEAEMTGWWVALSLLAGLLG